MSALGSGEQFSLVDRLPILSAFAGLHGDKRMLLQSGRVGGGESNHVHGVVEICRMAAKSVAQCSHGSSDAKSATSVWQSVGRSGRSKCSRDTFSLSRPREQ